MEGGGGFADIAADVYVVDQDGDIEAAFGGLGLDGGDLLLVAVGEEDPLADPSGVPAVGLVIGRGDHVLDALGDRGGHLLVPRGGAGMCLAAGGRGGDVLRLPDGGGEVCDRDDLGHLLDSRVRGTCFPARALAVFRAQGDAFAVGLHHHHVAVREARLRVPGPLLVEVVGPGGKVLGQPGELGAGRS